MLGPGRCSGGAAKVLRLSQTWLHTRTLTATSPCPRPPPHTHAHEPPPPQVGPGVKALAENDWVIPMKPNLGTWRSLAGAHARAAGRSRRPAGLPPQ